MKQIKNKSSGRTNSRGHTKHHTGKAGNFLSVIIPLCQGVVTGVDHDSQD